jgi:hypothetical protein
VLRRLALSVRDMLRDRGRPDSDRPAASEEAVEMMEPVFDFLEPPPARGLVELPEVMREFVVQDAVQSRGQRGSGGRCAFADL